MNLVIVLLLLNNITDSFIVNFLFLTGRQLNIDLLKLFWQNLLKSFKYTFIKHLSFSYNWEKTLLNMIFGIIFLKIQWIYIWKLVLMLAQRAIMSLNRPLADFTIMIKPIAYLSIFIIKCKLRTDGCATCMHKWCFHPSHLFILIMIIFKQWFSSK